MTKKEKQISLNAKVKYNQPQTLKTLINSYKIIAYCTAGFSQFFTQWVSNVSFENM